MHHIVLNAVKIEAQRQQFTIELVNRFTRRKVTISGPTQRFFESDPQHGGGELSEEGLHALGEKLARFMGEEMAEGQTGSATSIPIPG